MRSISKGTTYLAAGAGAGAVICPVIVLAGYFMCSLVIAQKTSKEEHKNNLSQLVPRSIFWGALLGFAAAAPAAAITILTHAPEEALELARDTKMFAQQLARGDVSPKNLNSGILLLLQAAVLYKAVRFATPIAVNYAKNHFGFNNSRRAENSRTSDNPVNSIPLQFQSQ